MSEIDQSALKTQESTEAIKNDALNNAGEDSSEVDKVFFFFFCWETKVNETEKQQMRSTHLVGIRSYETTCQGYGK